MRLVFITHGDPDYVRDSLTEKGWREADCLAERVARWDVTRVYCSPLGRARDTASRSLEKLGMEAEILPWLEEFSLPVPDPAGGTRIPWDLFPSEWTREEQMFDRNRFVEAPQYASSPLPQAYAAVCAGLDGLLAAHGYVRDGGFYRAVRPNGDTLVFFCHFGITMTLMGHLLNLSPVPLWHGMFMAPTGVTILASEERHGDEAYFRCQVMGDTQHLTAAGEPVSPSGYFTDVFSK